MAVQAKLRTSEKGLTKTQVEEEIAKVKLSPLNASCGISQYIIATTTSTSKDLQIHIANLSGDNLRQGLFPVRIVFWDELCEMLDRHPRIARSIFPWLGLGDTPSFLAGKRLQWLRKDLRLSRSRFVSLCGFDSERQLERIESETDECGQWLLFQVAKKTGASSDWLCYGEGAPYVIEPLFWFWGDYAEEHFARLKAQGVSSAFVTVSDDTPKRVGLVCAMNDGQFRAFRTELSLEYIESTHDPRTLRTAYRFLRNLRSLSPPQWCSMPWGKVLPSKEHDLLYSGGLNPMRTVTAYDFVRRGKYWLVDLLSEVRNDPTADRRIYGDWFVEVRQKLRQAVPVSDRLTVDHILADPSRGRDLPEVGLSRIDFFPAFSPDDRLITWLKNVVAGARGIFD